MIFVLEFFSLHLVLETLETDRRNSPTDTKHQPKLSLSLKEKIQNPHGSYFLYPVEIKLHTFLFKWSLAGLQTVGKVKARKNMSKNNFTTLFFKLL